MRMEITIATIGRLMKNSAMMGSYFGGVGLGRRARRRCEPSDPAARGRRLRRSTRSPGFSPSAMTPQRADARVDLHRAHVDGVVGPDDRDLLHALHVLDGALGDRQRVLLRLDDGPHLGVLAGAEHVAGIREHAAREHGAGRHVDLAIERDGASRGWDTRCRRRGSARARCPRRARVGVPAAEHGERALLADRELRVDRIDLGDRRQRVSDRSGRRSRRCWPRGNPPRRRSARAPSCSRG